jgi:hypothetical protein
MSYLGLLTKNPVIWVHNMLNRLIWVQSNHEDNISLRGAASISTFFQNTPSSLISSPLHTPPSHPSPTLSSPVGGSGRMATDRCKRRPWAPHHTSPTLVHSVAMEYPEVKVDLNGGSVDLRGHHHRRRCVDGVKPCLSSPQAYV